MSGPYDHEVALANAGDSEELLNELIEVFRQECPVLIEQIRIAIEDGDAPTLHRTAHTLKGSANVLGATSTAEVAQQIERFGRDGDLPAAAKQLPILQERVQQLQGALP